MIVLEIAGGILLAVALPFVVLFATGMAAVILENLRTVILCALGAALLYGLSTLGFLVPLIAWGIILSSLCVLGCILYGLVTGHWNVSAFEAQEWAEKSAFDKLVHRVAMPFVFLIVGGGGLSWALAAIGVLK